MAKSRRARKAEILRNRIIFILLLTILILSMVILFTGNDNKKNTTEPDSSSSMTVSSNTTSSSPPVLPESTIPDESSSIPSDISSPLDNSSSSSSQSSQISTPDDPTVDTTHPFYEAELPILVNPTNKIPDDYTLDVAPMCNGYDFNRKGTEAYNAMLTEAYNDGITLWIVSAYRSHERQTTNFNNRVQSYKNQGYSDEDAYTATASIIAVPGYSEHSVGLALDINSLETSFENTKEFTWLIENCADFGFILRYPEDKVDITEISYEPWHYRYVGNNHAKIIMENQICLEEYLSGDY